MPLRTEYSRISKLATQGFLCFNSLELFRRRLEKAYYADVLVRGGESDDNRYNITVEFQINLTLVEFLDHIQLRNMGLLAPSPSNEIIEHAFGTALTKLRLSHSCEIDIEELTFLLTDSEITIKRIYENSIEEQLGNILDDLVQHFTKNIIKENRIPWEIFIPVFEENLEEQFKHGTSTKHTSSSKENYFNFWGIYFSHNDDAVIYDLGMRSIISGDLYMLD